MKLNYVYECALCRGEMLTSEAYDDPRAFVLQAGIDPGGMACAGCNTLALLSPEGVAWAGRVGTLPDEWRGFWAILEQDGGDTTPYRPVTRIGRPEGRSHGS